MNKEDKVLLMDCLELLNNAISGTIGHYDLRNPNLHSFLHRNDIYVNRYGARNMKEGKNKANYFVYTHDSGNKTKANPNPVKDEAHDLLRHIRNSIAHSLVTKPRGKNTFQLQDKNKCGNESMVARIRVDLLKPLLEEIKQTYH